MEPLKAASGTESMESRSSSMEKPTYADASLRTARNLASEWLNIASVLDPEEALNAVSAVMRIPVEDITGRGRNALTVAARHLWWAVLAYVGGWSIPQTCAYTGATWRTVSAAVKSVPVELMDAVAEVMRKSAQ